jgi:hypothetical protein
MTNNQALKILKQYNLWRRDKNDINKQKMPNPTDIGDAIDVAIKLLKIKTNDK